jgi:3D-(3,5/4)-trihydroxycyclohexane-1,2-dione acylhydrolase (decyclizing)
MASEIATSIQEGYKLNIILLDNHGYSSIGGLSRSIGSQGFGTSYRCRTPDGQLDGDYVPVDFAALCSGLGAYTVRATTYSELESALESIKSQNRTSAVVVEVDPEMRVPGYESWWDVPISEVSELASIRQARAAYETAVTRERRHEVGERRK